MHAGRSRRFLSRSADHLQRSSITRRAARLTATRRSRSAARPEWWRLDVAITQHDRPTGRPACLRSCSRTCQTYRQAQDGIGLRRPRRQPSRTSMRVASEMPLRLLHVAALTAKPGVSAVRCSRRSSRGSDRGQSGSALASPHCHGDSGDQGKDASRLALLNNAKARMRSLVSEPLGFAVVHRTKYEQARGVSDQPDQAPRWSRRGEKTGRQGDRFRLPRGQRSIRTRT